MRNTRDTRHEEQLACFRRASEPNAQEFAGSPLGLFWILLDFLLIWELPYQKRKWKPCSFLLIHICASKPRPDGWGSFHGQFRPLKHLQLLFFSGILLKMSKTTLFFTSLDYKTPELEIRGYSGIWYPSCKTAGAKFIKMVSKRQVNVMSVFWSGLHCDRQQHVVVVKHEGVQAPPQMGSNPSSTTS